MDAPAIIRRIETRLVEIGMSKSEFYEKSGIAFATFSQWKSQHYNPGLQKLRNAANVLGVSYEYLVSGVDPAYPLTPKIYSKEVLELIPKKSDEKISKEDVLLLNEFVREVLGGRYKVAISRQKD